jgi:hypothetical protein
MKRILIACLLTTSLLIPGQGSRAGEEPAASAPAAKPAAKAKQMPFRGKINQVNADTKMITLAGKEKDRSFRITTTTRIHRDGTPLAFADVKAGAMVGGLARANEAGEWEVVTLNLGVKGSQPAPNESDSGTSSE